MSAQSVGYQTTTSLKAIKFSYCQSMRLLILACVAVTSAYGVDLYSYGSAVGDRQHPTEDDACIDSYTFPVVMFGQPFRTIYVCTNGLLSLGRTYTTYTPRRFPLTSSTTIIAPYWADGDPRVGGKVWSRVTTDPALLQSSSTSVKRSFQSAFNNGFSATRLLIATWDDVKPFGGSSSDLGNTFQVAVASDGNSTYTIFNYKEIHYTHGSASSGTPAQVGFDAGDGKNYYSTPSSRSSGIANVASSSNVGVTGRLIFFIGEYKDIINTVVVIGRPTTTTTTNRFTMTGRSTTMRGSTTPTTTPYIGIRLPDRVVDMNTTMSPTTTTQAKLSGGNDGLIKRILDLTNELNRLTMKHEGLLRSCKLKVPVGRKRRRLDPGLDEFRKEVLRTKIAILEDKVAKIKASNGRLSVDCTQI